MRANDPALLALAQSGDAAAIEQVLALNRPLVLVLWQRFARTMDVDDACQVGSLGVLKAIARFDPRRGNAWSTVAYWWIRCALGKAIRCDNLIRHPSAREYGDAPSITWIDAPCGKRESGIDLAADRETPAEIAEAAENSEWIASRFDELAERDPRMVRIIRGRFGFDGEVMTLRALGRELGITRERVRQLEREALDRIAGRQPKRARQYRQRLAVV